MKYLKTSLIFLLLFFPFIASASLASDLGLDIFGSGLNLPTENSPRTVVSRIINSLLTFLGMLFTILIIYGGFKWMTSQGNSQQVDEAKTLIKNATIGLVIVLTSYIITRFIFRILQESTYNPTVGGASNIV